jgi:transposase
MKRSSTPSFVLELPLVVHPREERKLLASFEAGRRLYNACLGQALERLDQMRSSEAWRIAQALPKWVDKKRNPERRAAFKLAIREHRFTSAEISAFGTQCKNRAGWQDRLGAHDTQRTAERAFNAAQEYSFGKRGRPRFKGARRPLHSMESKTNNAGIRWRAESRIVEWNGLVLPVLVPGESKDKYNYVQEALTRRTKYCRLLWRVVSGKRRWFVQLVQEGQPPRRYATVEGVRVGIDIGPSSVAVVGDRAADLVRLAPSVEQPWRKVRRLQRRLDRSRRATNPDCFNADGTWKRGATLTVRSQRYEAVRKELAETERVLAQRRSRDHGRLCNQILAQGNVIQAESLSYKAFQKTYGRSVKVRAPGSLITQLTRKAESAGGKFVRLETWKLRLSQFDHTTATFQKKALNERWHLLGDGSGMVQRDIYSAFLAKQVCVSAGNHAHPSQIFDGIVETWVAAHSLLRRTGWAMDQCASVGGHRLPTARTAISLPAPERIVRQRGPAQGYGAEAVSLRDPLGDALRTPRL